MGQLKSRQNKNFKSESNSFFHRSYRVVSRINTTRYDLIVKTNSTVAEVELEDDVRGGQKVIMT